MGYAGAVPGMVAEPVAAMGIALIVAAWDQMIDELQMWSRHGRS